MTAFSHAVKGVPLFRASVPGVETVFKVEIFSKRQSIMGKAVLTKLKVELCKWREREN